MFNKFIGYGRLTADPDFRQTPSGTSMVRFTVAIDRPYKSESTGEKEADFINCVAWRGTAEFISKWFSKGSAIIVEGDLRNNNYTDNNGVKHYSMVVNVSNSNFGESKKNSSQNESPAVGYSGNQQANSKASGIMQKAKQSGVETSQEIGNLNDFEEIMSEGDVPF